MAKKKIPALKIEHVSDRGNLLYLSVIEFKRETYLCVIDTIKPTEITAYVLDYAEQENIDVAALLSFITHWFYAKSDRVPLSVAFARAGLTEWVMPIFRSFDTTYVSRVIGQPFGLSRERVRVRRRRVTPIQEGIEIRLKRQATQL